MRYFSPDLDISTFNRPPHTILREERSAHVFQRRNKPRNYKIEIIRRFCCKLCVISLPSWILRRLIALLTQFYVKNGVHTFSSVETGPETLKSQWFVDFVEILRYFSPVLDIATIKRPLHTILRAERRAHVFQRRYKPRNYKIAIIRRFWQKLCVIFPPT